VALLNIKLFDDWKATFVKSWSNRINALNGIVLTLLAAWPTAAVDLWNVLPAFLQSFLPQHFALFIPLALTGLSMWARVVIQEKMANGGK